MSDHDHGAPDAPARPVLPVTIRSTVPTTENGVLVLARIDAPTVGLPCSYLVLDPRSNTLALMAPCGCSVHHELSGLVIGLASAVADSHGATGPAAVH